MIVSSDPNASKPRFPLTERTDLSPSAIYLAESDLFNDGGVFDVATGREVTPQVRGYISVKFAQWIDDDTFVARALPKGSDKTGPVDLLTCSISDDDCTSSAKAVGTAAEVRFPVGEHQPF